MWALVLVLAGCSSMHVSPGCELEKTSHERMVCTEEAKGKAADIDVDGRKQ